MSNVRKDDVPAVVDLRDRSGAQNGSDAAGAIDQALLDHAHSCELQVPPLPDPVDRVKEILPTIIIYMHLGFNMESINSGLIEGRCVRKIKDQTLQKIIFNTIRERYPQLRPRNIRRAELPEDVLKDPTAQAVLQVLRARIAGQPTRPLVLPSSSPQARPEQPDQFRLNISDDEVAEQKWDSNQ